jgi:molybdenum cofactor guanylyltransferase
MAKHSKLPRPSMGIFGRNELAFLGTPCNHIKTLFETLIETLPYKIAVIEADHKAEENPRTNIWFTDKINFKRFDFEEDINDFEIKRFFRNSDLILVNGNHFLGKSQVVVVDPVKSLEKKLDKLTDVRLVILKDTDVMPEYLSAKISAQTPVILWEEKQKLIDFVEQFVVAQIPKLYGLVLAGGRSTRMGTDKGLLDYHGKSQRQWASDMMSQYCEKVFVSLNNDQEEPQNQPYIRDAFLDFGPNSGILSAFRRFPDAAWLVVACDLPYLNEETLSKLVGSRNPFKSATAFVGDEDFPEPVVTIYEPRIYPRLLEMLSLGYDCPRKTLINSDVELLTLPSLSAIANVNTPQEKAEAQRLLN